MKLSTATSRTCLSKYNTDTKLSNEIVGDIHDSLFELELTKAEIGGNAYPFNDPFFFIFNIAVGGNWPGSPDASTQFPQWMMVDYVRVFQK